MKKGLLIGGWTLLFCLTFIVSPAQKKGKRAKANKAYTKKREKKDDKFLDTQWWLGFKGGVNLSEAEPGDRFSAFSPINFSEEENRKTYSSFEGLAGQAGIEVTFYHKGFSFSLQPNYRRQRFSYSNDFLWEDANNPNSRLELRYEQDHEVDYIEIPLFIKYDFTKTAARPFIQVGAYYATLVGANKSLVVSGADFASGGVGPFENEEVIIGADDLFISSSVGVAGGVGVSYDVLNVRIIFDATYRYGLNNVTNAENRFSENQLSGIGDALDDLEFRNISFNLGILFPLRFLTKGYSATN